MCVSYFCCVESIKRETHNMLNEKLWQISQCKLVVLKLAHTLNHSIVRHLTLDVHINVVQQSYFDILVILFQIDICVQHVCRFCRSYPQYISTGLGK